ncbi:MAG TPA: carboxypeptidase regulatory-like domain-containing protein, partial [Bryobacteraceae bacterium]|nr:carboxypeptidase regulatory-like domain-containing protein [Bryobacteraceae bacterium]
MSKTGFAGRICGGFALLALLSPLVTAQSTITGVARDTSGAVMAGVRVEAASEALIERSRTATTALDGRYTIVDVRPGQYTITFTVEGFATVRQQIEIPANVTVPVDAEMKIGSVGESVTVESRVATVDVDNVAHPAVLSRSDMDAIPSARNMQSLGSYVPGIHLNTPDVAGSMQVQQTYITTHGNQAFEATYLLDGMLINSTIGDGRAQNYIDNAIVQETTYQTSNVTAEVSGGGVYTNMVPKDGGNQFHGDLFLGWVHSSFVGSNIDQNLIQRGVSGQFTVHKIEDFDGSVGGPIKRDKLWFLVTGRKQVSDLQSSGSFFSDGRPGIEHDLLYTGTGRLTWQVSPRNKFSGTFQRVWKTISADIVSSLFGLGAGMSPYNATNPDVSSLKRDPVMYYILQGKWTSTVTPRLLVQGGFSLNKEDFNVLYQPGVQKNPFTAGWYANASQLDVALLTRSVAGATNSYNKYDRYAWSASGAYVTGSHTIKFGFQDSYGPAFVNNVANGDAYYRYTNGVPLDVTAYNTPTVSKPRLNADLAIYAMDTWRYKRLSVTAGLRFEYLSAQIDPESAPAGRFVPARSFAQVDCSTVRGLGCFKNWAPRFGVVYDLFGNHKTAIKAGFGKYNAPVVTSVLNNFNPMFLTTVNIPWVNAPKTACAPACYPQGAGFGQGDLGPNPNPSFGILQNRHLDPNFNREYNLQYSAGVQRELWRGVTLNFNWNRRADYQQMLSLNYAVPPSAWAPYQITNPLDGTPLTLFNLQPSYFGLTPAVHQTNAPQSLRSNTYNGFETSVTARLPHGAFLYGGWTIERQVDRDCDMTAGANLYNDPNSLRFCDWTGSLYQDLGAVPGIPYRNDFKITGNLPLKWGFELSGSLYSSPVNSTTFGTNIAYNNTTMVYSPGAYFAGQTSGLYVVNWNVTSTTRYPADCNCPNPGGLVDPGLKQGSEVIPLVAPGARLTPQLNQLDLGLRRVFRPRENMTLSAEVQVFNVINA